MKSRFFICLVLMLSVHSDAQAEDKTENNMWRDWDITLGAGGEYEAVTPGVDEYKFEAIPYVDITYKDRFFLNVQRGLGAYLYESDEDDSRLIDSFSLGMAIGYDGGRDKDDFEDHTNLKGLGDLDGSPEAKLFIEAEIAMLEAELEFGHGLNSDGHDGWYVEAGLMLDDMVTEDLYLGVGPSVRFSNENYQQAYFGVTSTQASATGLSQYSPGGGIESVAFEMQAKYFLTESWSVIAKGGYHHLVGDAADSPFVDQKGQVQALFGIAYNF